MILRGIIIIVVHFAVVVNEINNSAALNAFKAVETYLSSAKIPGLRLGKVGRVELDSTQKYLTVDDGEITPNSSSYYNAPNLCLSVCPSGVI